ncbi:hypothetical protein NDU88_000467 [Pleurodeles waltl]|uniref:Uncharacterized protein n=1 Tax=Pleurodeles waltl TaxID=8319 RepID=A0AAV7URD5_PLEWA|nr:hypothetical protein NDU88_000467 [Pleurodeles waltl]
MSVALWRGQLRSWAAGPGGQGPLTSLQSSGISEQECSRTAQLRPTRLKRGSPHRTAHLFGASIVTFISPGRGTPSQSRRLLSCGGLQITGPSPGAPCITRGSLARNGLLSRQAPVPGPGRACPNQAGEPLSQGSPSPGFSSVPRARRHGARVSEDQRKPAASLIYLPGAPGHSPLQALHAPHTALTSEAAPSAGGPRSPGSPRRRQPGRHLWEPIDPVAASVHGSGCVDTGTGGISEVRELAGTARAA